MPEDAILQLDVQGAIADGWEAIGQSRRLLDLVQEKLRSRYPRLLIVPRLRDGDDVWFCFRDGETA